MTTRIRSRGGFTTSSLLSSLDVMNYPGFPPANTWVGVLGGYMPEIGSSSTMADTKTPNFKRRLTSGEIIPTNPLHSETRLVEVHDIGNGPQTLLPQFLPPRGHREEGFWLYEYMRAAGLTTVPHGVQLPESLLTNSERDDLITEVTTKCLAKRGTADSNLFESVAEYRQTFSMLRHPIRSLLRVLTDPRRSALSKAAKSASDAWLMYRYGVLPLVRDISGIIEGLSKSVGKRRTSSRASGELHRESNRIVVGDWEVHKVGINVQTFDVFSVRCVSLDEHVSSLANNVGFTSKGLITLPWEFIPYSFVSDWFANVGDFLNALAPALGFKQLSSSLSTLRQRGTTYTAVSTNLNAIGIANGHQQVRNCTGVLHAKSIVKTRSSMGGKPGLVIRSDFGFDRATRELDAFALAHNLFDGLLQKR